MASVKHLSPAFLQYSCLQHVACNYIAPKVACGCDLNLLTNDWGCALKTVLDGVALTWNGIKWNEVEWNGTEAGICVFVPADAPVRRPLALSSEPSCIHLVQEEGALHHEMLFTGIRS